MPDKMKIMDNSGNMRNVSSTFIRKQMNDKSASTFFLDGLSSKLEELSQPIIQERKVVGTTAFDFPPDFKPYNSSFRFEPVDSRYFFSKMLGESLTEVQQKDACDIICGIDPFKFTDTKFKEVDLFWGKRSGKDATIAKCFAYQGYKLSCMIDPHEVLGMGLESSIDLVNVSKSGRQARNVFFKYLKAFVKRIKDPGSGNNWFSMNNWWYDYGEGRVKYMDLREGEAIKKEAIEFGRGITAHSLNSDTYTGEGLNIVLGVIDELGSMPPQKVFGGSEISEDSVGLYDSLKSTIDATSTLAKLVVLSYKYSRNCSMSILVRVNQKDDTIKISRKGVHEVRPDFDMDKLRKHYTKNPTKAKMMYDVAETETDTNSFYDIPFVLDAVQDKGGRFVKNPVKGGKITIDNISGLFNMLEPWFIGKEDRIYTAHVDLAKGQVWKGNDAIGLAIGHSEQMRVMVDDKLKKYIAEKIGILSEDIDEIEGELRNGIVVDLAVQIVCRPEDGEVRASEVRKFIINLSKYRKFNFLKVTYDGYQSLESVQEFNKYGIDCEVLSVDKDPHAYATEKDMIMLGLYKIYPNKVWRREKGELIEDQHKRKIEHPEYSVARLDEEGINQGSKDVSDSTAAISKTIMEDISLNSNPVMG
jgi:hypothetical protein